LDLLLSLIEKHKIDIYDIEISLLLDQYIEYIETARQYDIELAADFLEMASQLMYIKSCSLLPKKEEEEEDPKQLLEQMLIEYSKYKKISSSFQKMYMGGKVFFREWEPDNLPKPLKEYNYTIDDLKKAYDRLMIKLKRMQPISVSSFSGIIGTKFVSVGSRVIYILRILLKKGKTTLKDIFGTSRERPEIVATFLAILELIRHGRIETEDSEQNGISEDVKIILHKEI
jgi:segregation and condensation protein A